MKFSRPAMRRPTIRGLRRWRKRLRLTCGLNRGRSHRAYRATGLVCNRFRVEGTQGQMESEPFLSYQGNRLWRLRGPECEEVQIEERITSRPRWNILVGACWAIRRR